MRKIHYTQLGATLFVPATHKYLDSILRGTKYPKLRSMVVDFEDGLATDALNEGMLALEKAFLQLKTPSPFVFIRPRDPQHLSELMACDAIKNVDGFVLPKFSLNNAENYLAQFMHNRFYIMPSIEGEELFSHEKLDRLKTILSAYEQRIILVRFGLEDMLKALGMRRSCDESVFDRSAPSFVLGRFIATFKSDGFALSGGVYPCYKDHEGFMNDVRRDLKEGLFSKTIIHPDQIDLAHECYKVSQKEYDEAVEIVQSQKTVFAQNGKMAEVHTMYNYSKELVARGKIYGVS